jgi:hypothetical protein
VFGSGLVSTVGDDEDVQNSSPNLPPPPPPPGISFPPMPPPPSPDMPLPPPPPGLIIEESELSDDIFEEVASEIPPLNAPEVAESPSSDFNTHWQNRKAADPSLTVGNRGSMYGHIDRIASGNVGTLLDRFSDRFGSELDREIIVLRKKQQQEMREIKPTVELIQAPSEDGQWFTPDEDEDDETPGGLGGKQTAGENIEGDSEDEFGDFFNIVNTLLGNMPDDFVQEFIESESFNLFQIIGADPVNTDDETRSEFFKMINSELGNLPEDKINDFVTSPDFEVYTRIGAIYGE